MSGRNGLTSTDRSDGADADATPVKGEDGGATEQHRAPQRISPVRLRIVYNRDAQQDPRTMKSRPPSQPSGTPKAMLDRELQGKIGRMLRDVFSDVAKEPIPDRFLKLLAALGEKEKDR